MSCAQEKVGSMGAATHLYQPSQDHLPCQKLKWCSFRVGGALYGNGALIYLRMRTDLDPR